MKEKKIRLRNTVSTVRENALVTICVLLLTAVAVTVTLLLLRTPEEAHASQAAETAAVTGTPPAPKSDASKIEIPAEETSEPPSETSQPPATPTPVITPPAASAASGSDIILNLVDPPENTT